ncbi:MAG: ion channel [Albidovulum sp.]|nr:ion channel [Albidovulum sp.]
MGKTPIELGKSYASMTTTEKFWHLNDCCKIKSQENLLEMLKTSKHLIDALYMPNDLKRTDGPQQTRIRDKIFERVSFSKTHISGFIFRNCIFKNCLFIGTAIGNCEFHNCKFVLTNTHKIKISGTYIDPNSFNKCLDQSKHQNIGVHLYQILLDNSRGTRQIEFERDAQFLFLRWKRFQEWYEIQNWPEQEARVSRQFVLKCLAYTRRLAWEKLFGSGLRVRYFFGTVTFAIALFSTLNYQLRDNFGLMRQGEPVSSCLETIYYTIISFTTLGYGDIVPTTSMGQFVASAQSLIGFSLLALFASMCFRKISP